MGRDVQPDPVLMLLVEALDLCARGRRLEEIDHDTLESSMGRIGRVCITIPLYISEQYRCDLDSWERRASAALSKIEGHPVVGSVPITVLKGIEPTKRGKRP